MIPAILSLIAGIGCYAITQLQQHGKLLWQGKDYTFWGLYSDVLKYKCWPLNGAVSHEWAPKTWYYRFFKIKYKERFPLSATALVFLTDGYHLFQALFFSFLSLSFAFLLGWWCGLCIFFGIRIVHFLARKLFSK